ncbi:hypothetical protein B0H13DRAFT_1916344 [Mycena leptocephala]|nr:hypothetical protein B0H13DRAFT_1916344 [Mycena leptocephala]
MSVAATAEGYQKKRPQHAVRKKESDTQYPHWQFERRRAGRQIDLSTDVRSEIWKHTSRTFLVLWSWASKAFFHVVADRFRQLSSEKELIKKLKEGRRYWSEKETIFFVIRARRSWQLKESTKEHTTAERGKKKQHQRSEENEGRGKGGMDKGRGEKTTTNLLSGCIPPFHTFFPSPHSSPPLAEPAEPHPQTAATASRASAEARPASWMGRPMRILGKNDMNITSTEMVRVEDWERRGKGWMEDARDGLVQGVGARMEERNRRRTDVNAPFPTTSTEVLLADAPFPPEPRDALGFLPAVDVWCRGDLGGDKEP